MRGVILQDEMHMIQAIPFNEYLGKDNKVPLQDFAFYIVTLTIQLPGV